MTETMPCPRCEAVSEITRRPGLDDFAECPDCGFCWVVLNGD